MVQLLASCPAGFRLSCRYLSGGKERPLPTSTLAVQKLRSTKWFGVSNKPVTKGKKESSFQTRNKIFLSFSLQTTESGDKSSASGSKPGMNATTVLRTSCGAKAGAHFWNFPFCFYRSSGHCVESAESVVPGLGCAQVTSLHPLLLLRRNL